MNGIAGPESLASFARRYRKNRIGSKPPNARPSITTYGLGRAGNGTGVYSQWVFISLHGRSCPKNDRRESTVQGFAADAPGPQYASMYAMRGGEYLGTRSQADPLICKANPGLSIFLSALSIVNQREKPIISAAAPDQTRTGNRDIRICAPYPKPRTTNTSAYCL